MLFGHNTNVKVGETTFHVQTEDLGLVSGLIDTTVYYHGRVLHRRTNNYLDLLPMTADREEALKLRLNEQHRTVLEEIRTGALHLAPPPAQETKFAPGAPAAQPVLHLELVNAKTWLSGKRASLHVAVRDHTNKTVEGAKITARVDGAAELTAFTTETKALGQAQLEFDMPRLLGADPALVIEAVYGERKGQLRFQLRAKPRVPTAS
jgi:hypothetical protein